MMAIFMSLSALCSGALTISIKPAFDSILTSTVLWSDVQRFLITIMVIFVGKGIGQLGERLCVARIVSVTIDRLQKRMMDDVLHKPFSFFQTISSGELVSRIVGDLSQIRQHLINVMLVLGKESITTVVLFSVLLWMDWRLSLTLFTLAAIIALPLVALTKHMRHMTSLAQEHNGHVAGQLGTLFTFIKTIKACGAEDKENKNFRDTTRSVERYWRHAFWFHAWNFPLLEIGAGFLLTGILAYGVFAIKTGAMTIGSLIGFLGTLLFLYESIKRLLYASGPIQEIQTILLRIETLLSIPPPPSSLPSEAPDIFPPHRIVCHDVSFDSILAPVSLKISGGKRIAITGKSGVGKTTLCDLLAGFYQPTTGTITINKQDILSFTPHDLRQMVAYLPQESAVFEGSVLSNLWTNDENKALQLLEEFGLKQTANVATLSGGELRRLSLCRVLLRDCPIYIVDEPLTGLDAVTKKTALRLIDQMTKSKTTIIVSHDPIDFADETYALL